MFSLRNHNIYIHQQQSVTLQISLLAFNTYELNKLWKSWHFINWFLCMSPKSNFSWFQKTVNIKKKYLMNEFSFVYPQQQVNISLLDNMYMSPDSNLGLIQNWHHLMRRVWQTLTWIWKDLQNGLVSARWTPGLASDFKVYRRYIDCINNWNIGYFNVHVLPVTNEDVFDLF